MQMNLKYNSHFIHEAPSLLSGYNPLFMDIVRVSDMKGSGGGGDDGSAGAETFKNFIVLVNQLGKRQEIRLIDEEDHNNTKQI